MQVTRFAIGHSLLQNKFIQLLGRVAGVIKALVRQKIAKVYPTKAQAQAAGRKTAINQKLEHIIHNFNGKIGSHNSYGNDPHPPEGNMKDFAKDISYRVFYLALAAVLIYMLPISASDTVSRCFAERFGFFMRRS